MLYFDVFNTAPLLYFNQIATTVGRLPEELARRVMRSADEEERARLREALSALLEAAARRRAEEAEAARRAREEAILRETRRREALLRAAHRRILPPVSPLTGVSAAPCAVKHPPRDLHEASREAIKYWRFFR